MMTTKSAIDELRAIMPPEFWSEITGPHLRWLHSKQSIKQLWPWTWDGELRQLIVKHAPQGFFPPDAEERHKHAIEHLRKGYWQLIEAFRSVTALIHELAFQLPESSEARSAFASAAHGFETAMYDAMHDNYVTVMQALAWNYAVPEFPELPNKEVHDE